MENLYPKSGATLKKCVRVLNFIGYLVGDLLGVLVGILVWRFTQAKGMQEIVSVFVAWGAAAVAAAPLLFVVWFNGLVHWSIGDAAEAANSLSAQENA